VRDTVSALEQLQACQQGESAAEPTQVPSKSEYELSVLSKLQPPGASAEDDEPADDAPAVVGEDDDLAPVEPATLSDIDLVNNEAASDSNLRQNNPPPSPRGASHNLVEQDFNTMPVS